MTLPESEFQDIVQAWLERHYGRENVYAEPTLRTDRRPDFIVHTPLALYTVEVENDSDDVVGAVGQATLYASHDPRYVPVVVFPNLEANDREELRLLRQRMVVVELDPETTTATYAT